MKVNHNHSHNSNYLNHNNKRKDLQRQKNHPRQPNQLLSKPYPDLDRYKRLNIFCAFRLHNGSHKNIMPAWLIALYSFVILKSSYQTPINISTKKLNVQKYEDYTFEGVLNKAKEECSYMSLVNDTVFRNRTLQMIKEKISRKKLKEFYEQKEIEKQKAKEYYDRVEKQSRRRVLEDSRPRWDFVPPKPLPPPIPPLPPPPPPGFFHRNLYKRSTEVENRRRKGPLEFSKVSFTDHNNCSSRCLFARMEMVDSSGFPDESLITKLIEDKITNRKFRLLKMKKVTSCFKKMEEVSFDDSCIFSSRLFDCLDMGEAYSWSGSK